MYIPIFISIVKWPAGPSPLSSTGSYNLRAAASRGEIDFTRKNELDICSASIAIVTYQHAPYIQDSDQERYGTISRSSHVLSSSPSLRTAALEISRDVILFETSNAKIQRKRGCALDRNYFSFLILASPQWPRILG